MIVKSRAVVILEPSGSCRALLTAALIGISWSRKLTPTMQQAAPGRRELEVDGPGN